MYHVDLYRRVRLACHHDGLSHREAAHRFGIDRRAVSKILKHSTPPSGGKSPLVILLNSFLRGLLVVDFVDLSSPYISKGNKHHSNLYIAHSTCGISDWC